MPKLPSNFELDRYGLHVRLVREDDAEFIVKLRTDEKLSRYLHHTDANVAKQVEWIREYKKREIEGVEYYFVFLDNNHPIGTYRIYNVHDRTYTGGSWVCEQGTSFEQAVATAVILREIAFNTLGFKYEDGYDGVHVNNKQVYKFNKMVGMHETGRNGDFISMAMSKEDFEQKKPRLLKLIGYGE